MVSREVSVEVHKNSLTLETFIFVILKNKSLTDTLLIHKEKYFQKCNSSLYFTSSLKNRNISENTGVSSWVEMYTKVGFLCKDVVQNVLGSFNKTGMFKYLCNMYIKSAYSGLDLISSHAICAIAFS